MGAAALLLAACSNPTDNDAARGRKPGVQADTSAPRTCRGWTIDSAVLQCSSAVMQITDANGSASRIKAADAKLSRYGPLGADLCKDTGAAASERDQAAASALSDAVTRVQMDKTHAPSMIVALCHDTVIKLVARAEEHAEGRQATADLHPNVDDTPKTAQGGD